MRPNQKYHLLQWLMIIIIMELFLILVPVWIWIKLVIIGTGFLIGFLLRIARKYPGEYEPPAVDILTAIISYSFIIFFTFINDRSFQLGALIAIPFIILIPHFVYIIRNKDISTPGLRKILTTVTRKLQSRKNNR